MPAFLLMDAGENTGTRFKLVPAEENLLGRDWNCRIVLRDPQCSRVHAAIHRDDEGWWISDRKSSNGTYVNGQTIDTARLMDGTEVKIGSCRFTFILSKDASQEIVKSETMTSSTIVLHQALNQNETGHYTLNFCLLYTSPSPRDATLSRMPSSA